MRRRVLIVDDNRAFRAAARQLLERGGFVVVAEAGDGGEGLRAAKEHTPDVAIVDVQLPDLDGFEVAERLRALDTGARGDPYLEPRRRRFRSDGREQLRARLRSEGRAFGSGDRGAARTDPLRRAGGLAHSLLVGENP